MNPRGRGWLVGGGAVVAAMLLLPGCGFHPVYGTQGAAGSTSAQTALAAVSVDLIPERAGQLLRLALQERFERFGGAAPRRYALRASFGLSVDALAVQPDSTVTRIRLVGLSAYTLTTLETRRTVTSGTARAVDGLDVIGQQYFAADLQQDAVIRRLADALADQVALQLAVFFDAHAPTAAATPPASAALAALDRRVP